MRSDLEAGVERGWRWAQGLFGGDENAFKLGYGVMTQLWMY